ncbi:hypothetical protein F8M41_016581 [Gigaspora margarita]|uniref:Uncharacterized protein n=1 Tax=Gigaspora margarita TaxID=4874 RepID=A0A8H3ZZS8_GIGMA|nr:hypothetical protein F8M41_016581 [Gigaspora margarita]
MFKDYIKLISYLNEYKNKSFWGHDLDLSWSRHFLEEAKKLLNENDFNKLEEQINQEWQRFKNNIEEYWYYIISECNTKQEIEVDESAIVRLQLELTEIQKKAKLQDSSNREIEEDLVNEGLMFDDDDDDKVFSKSV